MALPPPRDRFRFSDGIHLSKCSSAANLHGDLGKLRRASQGETNLCHWPAGNGLPMDELELARSMRKRDFFNHIESR